jgi:hypothetical protein
MPNASRRVLTGVRLSESAEMTQSFHAGAKTAMKGL